MAKYDVVDVTFVRDHLFTLKKIDVRPRSYVEKYGFVPGAVNIEWEPVKEAGGDVPENWKKKCEYYGYEPGEEIIVYCHDGILTKQASEALAEAGYRRIKAYVGSFSDWMSYPEDPIEKL